jgi:hypothetical protein
MVPNKNTGKRAGSKVWLFFIAQLYPIGLGFTLLVWTITAPCVQVG